jgi:hypothetical protein
MGPQLRPARPSFECPQGTVPGDCRLDWHPGTVRIDNDATRFFVSNAGTASGQLRTALSPGSYRLPRNIAADLPRVDLADAIRLTALTGEKDSDRFDALAVRVLARLLDERRLSLDDALWACQRLRDCREGVDGETGLLSLAKQRPITPP